jgi:hypothetical protein
MAAMKALNAKATFFGKSCELKGRVAASSARAPAVVVRAQAEEVGIREPTGEGFGNATWYWLQPRGALGRMRSGLSSLFLFPAGFLAPRGSGHAGWCGCPCLADCSLAGCLRRVCQHLWQGHQHCWCVRCPAAAITWRHCFGFFQGTESSLG